MEREDLKNRMSVLRSDFGEKESNNIYGMEKQAQKQVNYLDLKQTAKEINEELEKLNKSLQKELTVAQNFGMTPEAANRIASIASDINKKTNESLDVSSKIKATEESIKANVKDNYLDAKIKVKDAIKQTIDGLVDKAIAGVATIGAFSDKVAEANRKAISVVRAEADTIYTRAEESINQVHRNYLSFNYNKDKAISNTLDKVTDTLEAAFQKSASIKEAIKDLGRAFMGKERQGDKGEYTPAEKAVVEKLRGISDGLKQEMSRLEKEFNLSKELSLQNIKSSQELRESAGMEKSESLQERFDSAKAESISSKRDAAEKSMDKQKDKDEKEKEM